MSTCAANFDGDQAHESLSYNHDPLQSVRLDVIGEVVMVERWRKFMSKPVSAAWDSYELVCPLVNMLSCQSSQRAAHVAASFIRWIGTNCGRAYLNSSKEALKTLGEDAYLLTWTRENKRFQGSRLIEHVLAPDGSYHQGGMLGTYLASVPSISDGDSETIESITMWLATAKGQQFLGECEADIHQRLADERQRSQEAYRARLTGGTVA